MGSSGGDKGLGSRTSFPSTVWALIRAAQKSSTDQRDDAMGTLLVRYWKPIYVYYRCQGKTHEQAADLVQDFFYSFLRSEKILKVECVGNRFRDWLMVCARHFMVDQCRREKAIKRRPRHGVISFEALKDANGDPFDPTTSDKPERSFDEAWRRDLLDRAFQVVAEECARKGRSDDLQIFLCYYCTTDGSQPTWQDIAKRQLLPSWKDAARKADWIKGRLAQAIRQEVSQYVDSDDDIDDEIRELFR